MNGWKKIIQRIKDDPSRSQILHERYMSLVSELSDMEDKYFKMLDLAEALLDIDAKEAYNIANSAYQLNRQKPNALELIFNILQIQGKYDQAQIVREQLQKFAGYTSYAGPLTSKDLDHTTIAPLPSDPGGNKLNDIGDSTEYDPFDGNERFSQYLGDDMTTVAPLQNGESLVSHLALDDEKTFAHRSATDSDVNKQDKNNSKSSVFGSGGAEFSLGNPIDLCLETDDDEEERYLPLNGFPGENPFLKDHKTSLQEKMVSDGDSYEKDNRDFLQPNAEDQELTDDEDVQQNSHISMECQELTDDENTQQNNAVTIELQSEESFDIGTTAEESLRLDSDDQGSQSFQTIQDISSEPVLDTKQTIELVDSKQRISMFRNILSKHLSSFESKISFIEQGSLELHYKDEWTKTELGIVLDALRDCDEQVLHNFITANWLYQPDKQGIAVLQALNLVDRDPFYWEVYLACLIEEGLARHALFEIRHLINLSDDMAWVESAWKYIQRVYKVLDFALFSWDKSDGVCALRECLNKKPKISYSMLFNIRKRHHKYDAVG